MDLNEILKPIVDLVSSDIDFQVVSVFVLGYFVALWFVFAGWVFFDAYKRYQNPYLALLWFIGVLIGLPPMLIFYLVVRPEHFVSDSSAIAEDTAVHVPIVNFVGEKGLVMSLQLQISDKVIDKDILGNQVQLGITLDGKDISEQGSTPTVSIDESVVQANSSEGSENTDVVERKNIFKKVRSAVAFRLSEFRRIIREFIDTLKPHNTQESTEDSAQTEQNNNNQHKKNKKSKKKNR